MPGEFPKKSTKSQWLKIHPANLIRLGNWRRCVISANTVGFGKGEALQQIRNALPIHQDIAY